MNQWRGKPELPPSSHRMQPVSRSPRSQSASTIATPIRIALVNISLKAPSSRSGICLRCVAVSHTLQLPAESRVESSLLFTSSSPGYRVEREWNKKDYRHRLPGSKRGVRVDQRRERQGMQQSGLKAQAQIGEDFCSYGSPLYSLVQYQPVNSLLWQQYLCQQPCNYLYQRITARIQHQIILDTFLAKKLEQKTEKIDWEFTEVDQQDQR